MAEGQDNAVVVDDGPIELPPLDAGARESGYPPLSIDSEPEPEPASKPETEPEEESEPESEPEGDDDVLEALRREAAEEANAEPEPEPAPAEKPKEEPKPEPKPAETPPADLEITAEDFDAAFEDVDKFKNVMGKVSQATEQRTIAKVNEQMHYFARNMTAQIEQMIYLNEAVRETPKILNYPDAFKVAYTKAAQKAKQGDLRTPVMEAVETVKREMGRLDAVKSTKKVDLRSKQQAPAAPKGAGRQAHSNNKPAQADDFSFLRNLT